MPIYIDACQGWEADQACAFASRADPRQGQDFPAAGWDGLCFLFRFGSYPPQIDMEVHRRLSTGDGSFMRGTSPLSC